MQQTKQNMLCAHVGMIQGFCFFHRQGEDLLNTRRIRNLSDHLLVRPSSHLFFHFHSHGFQIKSEPLKDVHGDPLAQVDQAEQQVLCADEVMVKTIGFSSSQCQHL